MRLALAVTLTALLFGCTPDPQRAYMECQWNARLDPGTPAFADCYQRTMARYQAGWAAMMGTGVGLYSAARTSPPVRTTTCQSVGGTQFCSGTGD